MPEKSLKFYFDSVQAFLYWQFRGLQRFFFHTCGVFFLTPHERTIGNSAEEIHSALLLARRLGKRMIILRRFVLFGAPRLPNRQIFELEGEGVAAGLGWDLAKFFGQLCISVIGHIFAFVYYLIINTSRLPLSVFQRKVLKRNVPIFYVHYRKCFFHQYVGMELAWRWDFPRGRNEEFKITEGLPKWDSEFESPVKIDFARADSAACESSLRLMGIKDGDWFVCLHNREPGYHEDKLDLRNSSISNYFMAVRKITEAGGWVIRMGDSSMTRLPQMDRVIDYPFSTFKSDLMDLYLIKNCRFYLGQNSGLVDVAYLFSKKCVLVNTTEWAIGFPRLENSRVIFKHFFSRSLQRYLSVRELLEQPFSVTDLHQLSREISVRENSPEEIAQVVSEVMTEEPIWDLQREFARRRKEQLLGWIKTPLHPDREQDRIFKYRLYSRALGCTGTAGRHYLTENWEKSSLN